MNEPRRIAVYGPESTGKTRLAEKLAAHFAAPLVATRDGGWVLLGFSNQEAEGVHDFAVGDPIPVRLDRSGAVARVEPVG